jgi:hypothetical protein
VFLKVEGDNPTGSFKDRGMTTAISVAKAEGATAVICASTGNTSASMAAFAARAVAACRRNDKNPVFWTIERHAYRRVWLITGRKPGFSNSYLEASRCTG